MSWTGLKKAINRAGAQVMLQAGQLDKTMDPEFDFEEKRFRTMQTSSVKLQKELKHYLDSLRILNNAQVNVGEVMSSFYGTLKLETQSKDDENENEEGVRGDAFSSVAGLYFDGMKHINDVTLAELEHPYRQTVLNPVERFNLYYVEIDEAVKKRARKQLDYDALRGKVRKLLEKPPADTDAAHDGKLVEIQQQLAEAEAAYSGLNDQLKAELPKLVNLRIPFLDPSFEAFVKIQLRFFNESYRQLNGLQEKMDAQTREDYVNGTLEKRLDGVLAKMRELNITGAD